MSQLTDSDDHVGPAPRSATPPPARPEPAGAPRTADLDELVLAAEEAEAEAVAAQAAAEAAVARARAVRLRRAAAAARSAAPTDRVGPAGSPAAPAGADAAAAGEPEVATEPGPAGESAEAEAEDGAGNETAAAGEPDAPTAVVEDATPRARVVRPRQLPRVRTLVGAVAVTVLAASAAASGALVHHHRELTQANQRKAEFVEAARQGVVALTSLDFSRAGQDVQRVLDHSTGAFRDDFAGRAEDFTAVIEQSQVATAGTVHAAAVESMTEDSAVVLVAATSQVTNSAGARQEPRAWRLSVTVTREGDTIKMSKVEFVP